MICKAYVGCFFPLPPFQVQLVQAQSEITSSKTDCVKGSVTQIFTCAEVLNRVNVFILKLQSDADIKVTQLSVILS